MDIIDATRSYERWLRRHCLVVPPHLRLKHERMRTNLLLFLRGTFYRWIQRWPELCPAAADAPAILSVGDLHIENFGTWRDAEGRLIWGVNDIDEACVLPYTQDLVRLATSAVCAIRQGHLAVSIREACDAILDGYRACRSEGGCPVVLAEHRQWLRLLALSDVRDPVVFWARLQAFSPARGEGVPHAALRSVLPDRLPYVAVRRIAGVGSLGRPRFVAIASWGGSLIAREAKALVPSASAWASGRAAPTNSLSKLQRRAVRVPDPFFAVHDHWIVRRLAPDCSRIDLDQLPRKRHERKLLRAMGWDTANLHLGAARADIDADLRARPRRWLESAAEIMLTDVERDWRQWRRRG